MKCPQGGFFSRLEADYVNYRWGGQIIFDAHYDYFVKMCEVSVIPAAAYKKMPQNPCQCDFHPGNFKYDSQGFVCGSFDYDMAKIDARLFEVGLAMHYCFASWQPNNDGEIHLPHVEKFIRTYNEELTKLKGLTPLNPGEKQYLYESIVQGTLYVLGWCAVACVYDPTLNPYEYLFYTRHFVHCLKWLEAEEAQVRELFRRL